jgi:hypothetical protein
MLYQYKNLNFEFENRGKYADDSQPGVYSAWVEIEVKSETFRIPIKVKDIPEKLWNEICWGCNTWRVMQLWKEKRRE